MPYTSPSTVTTGTTITSAWGNSVKAGEDFLANPPSCRVYNNAAISVANGGAESALTFNSERYDTDNMHSTVTNTGRITFNTAGLYAITFHVAYAPNVTGDRIAAIRLNGTTFISYQALRARSNAGGNTAVEAQTIYKMAVNDYIEAMVNQDSGGALNVNTFGSYSPEFAATWIGLG